MKITVFRALNSFKLLYILNIIVVLLSLTSLAVTFSIFIVLKRYFYFPYFFSIPPRIDCRVEYNVISDKSESLVFHLLYSYITLKNMAY